MSIFFLTIASFILYGKSKHFPKEFSQMSSILAKNTSLTRILAYLFMTFSAYLFILEFDLATGLVLTFIAYTLIACILLIFIPLFKNSFYVFLTLVVVLLLVDVWAIYN
jgi:hypothetical protein